MDIKSISANMFWKGSARQRGGTIHEMGFSLSGSHTQRRESLKSDHIFGDRKKPSQKMQYLWNGLDWKLEQLLCVVNTIILPFVVYGSCQCALIYLWGKGQGLTIAK